MDEVATVRRFHRTVTQRVGARQDAYLGRGRPLGTARVLWEVGGGGDAGAADGTHGVRVRLLRERLGLDSGYLSRLLRRLEADGLVEVGVDPDDLRVRVVRLTPAGVTERELLDRESDALAASVLDPLTPRQRTRLVEAMATVDQLLAAGRVRIDVEDPGSPAARRCLAAYVAELDERFDAGFDPAASISAAAEELVEPRGLFLVAWLDGEPVGCGALKLHDAAPAEIKRMWVSPGVRGLGVGRRVLLALEGHARDRGVGVVRLETNRRLPEAVALYRASGYAEVPAFNEEPYAHHWFEKRLTT